MNNKKLLTAVLLGMLLAMSLAGEAGAREKAEDHKWGTRAEVVSAVDKSPKSMSNAWKYITIPAAFFHPVSDGCDWVNNGNYVTVYSGNCDFTAPVVFPGKSVVYVRKMNMYAYDNNGSNNMWVALVRTNPTDGTQGGVAYTSTSGASTSDPVTVKTTAISPANVSRGKGVYLLLSIASSNHRLYGVKIFYE